ncbi:DUF5407 domain-containing protein [Chlamydiia bacterium]|nr:DUF5407 domain-containing protein [Chlamydiia bacterium]
MGDYNITKYNDNNITTGGTISESPATLAAAEKKNWGSTSGKGISVEYMFKFVSDQTDVVNQKLESIRNSGETISITDMFEMQMKMNRLSQYSEMATSVVSAAGGAIQSIARNVK